MEIYDKLINEIDKTIDRGNVDKETLEFMKEILNNSKNKCSITEYFKRRHGGANEVEKVEPV
jgi:hypothetical protein